MGDMYNVCLSVFGKFSKHCLMLDEYKQTIIKEKLLGSSDWLKEFSQLLLGIEDYFKKNFNPRNIAIQMQKELSRENKLYLRVFQVTGLTLRSKAIYICIHWINQISAFSLLHLLMSTPTFKELSFLSGFITA